MKFTGFYLVVCLAGLLAGCVRSKEAPLALDSRDPIKNSSYSAVFGDQKASIASVNPLATKAGLSVLNQGGNAIDAAVAVAFALGVVDSHNSGIGGGCFILARLADGQILALDGREMAPAAATRDMYVVNGQVQSEWSKTGALASGIPGSVAALYELQQSGGKLEFEQVLAPAITLAEEGFSVGHTLAARIAAKQEDLYKFPAAAEIFLHSDGSALAEGEILVQPDLANSYRALAKQGPAWFYHGEFAEKTERWMSANGGIISAVDFAAYKTARRAPVNASIGNYSVLGFPPPSSGGTHVAQILNMLANYDLLSLQDADRYHVIAAAMSRAFADRAQWLGDSDHVKVPEGLADPEYAKSRMAGFDFAHVSDSISYGNPQDMQDFDKHTTHIATADKQGNWVAITTTLNTSFGSKVVIPGTGVLMNNQMDDFSALPGVPNAFGLVGSEANSIAPGKRPLSSMSPTIVLENNQPVITIGAAGGPTIISQVAQALIYRLQLNYPLEEAVAAKRVHHQWQPNLLFIEPGTGVEELLSAKGYRIKSLGSFGATQAIELRDEKFIAVTEPRLIEREAK